MAAGLAIIAFSLLVLLACSQEKKEKVLKKRTAVPVTTALGTTRTIPVEISATGHVEALHTVEIRAQVTGVLQTVHFREGQEVKAGDPLFTIDPRPFAADLAKAEALLAKDKADLENARRDQTRYQAAATRGLVSREQADQALTRVATLTASVKADQATVESARLALGHCSIRAPFTGRSGEILSDQGNLIKANADTPMASINSMDPILINFTLAGQHLQDIMSVQRQHPIRVLARQGPDQPLVDGQLVFIDNTVDPATGVIRLKAEFANDRRLLWPGQLMDVSLHLGEMADAVVVPSQAVQMGQQGAYLFVVRPDQSVQYRLVTSGMRFLHSTVIKNGLKSGEKVVIDGQMLLEDGTKVVERRTGNAVQGAKQP